MKTFVSLSIVGFLLSAVSGHTDQQFYQDQLWDISLHEAGGDNELRTSQTLTTCDATSRLWADHQIVFTYGLTDANHGAFSLSVLKNTWVLKAPSNPAKPVTAIVNGFLGPVKYPFTVTNAQTLLTSFPTDQNFSADLDQIERNAHLPNDNATAEALQVMTMNLMQLPAMLFNSKGKPSGMSVIFSGTEPAWTYPADDPYQSMELARALNQCLLTLVTKTSAQAAPGALTSPIAEEPESSGQLPQNENGAVVPPPAPSGTENPFFSKRDIAKGNNGSPSDTAAAKTESEVNAAGPVKTIALDDWKFSSGNEDWGKTCFVEAASGEKKVGFMAAPGKDLVGYVAGVFDGDTRATWQVDKKDAHTSQGGPNDYFGWYEFGDLPPSLLTEVGSGSRQLSIKTKEGKDLVVGLTGASAAVAAFQQCFGQ